MISKLRLTALYCLCSAVIFLFGCSSVVPVKPDPEVYVIGQDKFEKSKSNKYGIVIKGEFYKFTLKESGFLTPLEIRAHSKYVEDEYVIQDIHKIAVLLLQKNYNVYHVSDVREFEQILKKIILVSNSQTEIFIAYSGHGDLRGGLTKLYSLNDRVTMIPTECILTPSILIDSLNKIPGNKCVLLNACESGCFVDYAKKSTFKGVILASCAAGYSTTPCENSGYSAIFSAFFELYKDPNRIFDLSKIELSPGHWWSNFRHKWVDFWNPKGKPISYDAVMFSSQSFLF